MDTTVITQRGQFVGRCKALFNQRLITYREYSRILANTPDEEYDYGRKSVREVLDDIGMEDITFDRDVKKKDHYIGSDEHMAKQEQESDVLSSGAQGGDKLSGQVRVTVEQYDHEMGEAATFKGWTMGQLIFMYNEVQQYGYKSLTGLNLRKVWTCLRRKESVSKVCLL